MTGELQKYFPMIRSREAVISEILSKEKLKRVFDRWPLQAREEFLDFCSGCRGVKMHIFIPLDIFRKLKQNKDGSVKIGSRLDAWLAFLCMDEPEAIISIIEKYPDFRKMYEQIYTLCQNIEEVMQMFSRKLQEMDRNTVKLMIDEMQKDLDEKKRDLKEIQKDLDEKNRDLEDAKKDLKEAQVTLRQKDTELSEKDALIRTLQLELEQMSK